MGFCSGVLLPSRGEQLLPAPCCAGDGDGANALLPSRTPQQTPPAVCNGNGKSHTLSKPNPLQQRDANSPAAYSPTWGCTASHQPAWERLWPRPLVLLGSIKPFAAALLANTTVLPTNGCSARHVCCEEGDPSTGRGWELSSGLSCSTQASVRAGLPRAVPQAGRGEAWGPPVWGGHGVGQEYTAHKAGEKRTGKRIKKESVKKPRETRSSGKNSLEGKGWMLPNSLTDAPRRTPDTRVGSAALTSAPRRTATRVGRPPTPPHGHRGYRGHPLPRAALGGLQSGPRDGAGHSQLCTRRPSPEAEHGDVQGGDGLGGGWGGGCSHPAPPHHGFSIPGLWPGGARRASAPPAVCTQPGSGEWPTGPL